MRGLLTMVSSLLLAGFTLSGSAGGQPASVNGLIAFDRYVGSTQQVWVMDQDGSHPRRLGDGGWPAWSRDGTRLAYVTITNSSERLAVIDVDGGGRRLVSISFPGDPDFTIYSPAWSPDGKTIAFGRNDGLYSVSSDGGAATRLAAGYDAAPAWSPDGTQIAYIAQDGALTVMRADGSAAEVVPGAKGDAGRGVAWSPDGSEIAYGDAISSGVSTVRLDGSPPTALIPYLGNNSLSDPAWSPDGRRIAFFDNADICVANADGSEIGRLTYTPVDAVGTTSHPAWQPVPPASAPAGPPSAISGPVGRWNRSYSWYPACRSIWRGLAVTAAAPTRTDAGSLTTVTLTVTNQGGTPLGESGLVGLGATVRNGTFVQVTPSQGNCPDRQTHEINCALGALFPAQRAQIRLRLRAGSPGDLVLKCYLPRPADAADTTPLLPDCVRRIRVRRA